VGSYVERNTSGTVTKAYLYIAARRGGRFIYALDVTSPTAPKFLWKKGCSSLAVDATCDAGFAEMGQTWSQPQIIKVKANTNPVLIFGGGYDPVSEDPEVPATVDTMGRGVFVLDAFTGTLVWSAVNSTYTASTTVLPVTGMDFSIAADLLPIDRTFDGYVDRVYAADVGGNVWRLDIGDAAKADWKVWKIASVGARPDTVTTRKFLFGMDVVLGASFDAVVIGSGDREHPLATNDANDVINRVYMFKDTTGPTGSSLGISDTCEASVTTSCSNLFDATNSSAVPATALGWSITLDAGEKVVNAPVVAGGNMLFGTNQPDTSNLSCSPNLGIAKRYSINYLNAAGTQFKDSNGNLLRSEIAVGGGFLPSTVTGVVDVDGKKIIFATDNPLNPGGAIKVTITVPTKRYRTYWHQKIE
jgi:type IV pilus assembly protein PilY1